MIVGYHCTDVESADKILKDGFSCIPKDEFHDFFVNLDELAKMIGYSKQKIDALIKERTQYLLTDTDKFIDIELKQTGVIAREWLKKFGHGTIIWVSKEPNHEYGPCCLEVKLPKSAKLVVEDDDQLAYWFPKNVIPSKNFKII